jgi:peptidoglycan/xylan/chitin deacetylase (PgdA/CDA1 family)
VGVAHFATRAVSAISRPTAGKDFSDLIALGCQVITRFDDAESVYLTFDDSPNSTSTLSILNELAKQTVPAPFNIPISSGKFGPRAMRSETTQ